VQKKSNPAKRPGSRGASTKQRATRSIGNSMTPVRSSVVLTQKTENKNTPMPTKPPREQSKNQTPPEGTCPKYEESRRSKVCRLGANEERYQLVRLNARNLFNPSRLVLGGFGILPIMSIGFSVGRDREFSSRRTVLSLSRRATTPPRTGRIEFFNSLTPNAEFLDFVGVEDPTRFRIEPSRRVFAIGNRLCCSSNHRSDRVAS